MTKRNSVYKSLFLLGGPIIFQNLLSVSVGLADNIMVGSLGDLAISGIFVANQVQNILQMLVTGVSASIVLLSSQYWGKNDVKSVKNIVSIGMKFALLLAIIIGFVVFFFTNQVLGLFTNNLEVIAEGSKYIKIMAFSYIFFCLTNVFIASMRCVETVNITIILSISTLIVDIGLNYILIFGHMGFPAMGVRGAAVATLVARIIETAIITSYVRFVDKKLKLKIKDLFETNIILLKDFFKHGLPVLSGDILWGIAGSVQMAIIGRMGREAIAANSMALVLFSVVSVVAYGVSNATSIIIGKSVGAGEYDKVKEYTKKLQPVYVLIGVITSLVMFALRDVFISMYPVSPDTKDLVRQFINILCITVIGTSYHVPCFVGIIRAGGDTKFVLIVDSIFMWLYVIPLSAFAAFYLKWPPQYVFLCLKSDQLIKWTIAIVKTNRFKWIKNLTR